MSDILKVRNLCKTYVINKRQKHVLKNVNLEIKEGEFVAIMGPSGSGKSTLLYNISGMDKMTSGSVVFDGKNIDDLSEKELSKLRLHKMGFIFQQNNLLKNLSLIDNIIVSAYMARERKKKEINYNAIELMKKTAIIELADNDITQASGGQLQRVAICRALINEPKIVFGDEPTGALNSKSSEEIMDILNGINESGTTVMLVTHNVKVASKTERVLYMIDGKIENECVLGKYDKEKNDSKYRESKISQWLLDMGW
ncbi:ABC transporter ATP-binding protein [Clostridium sp. 'deep sea']|uniref:ABC transporter ATP-binding protein n=1 Tax=Clostridium sp. 'deep sea' TaxID=2779445 RepID=UPI00189649AC|nr:ABC transporter ATP-binding protein [Clostridium sp. 'deep sea']QOR34756.1 ABC transporter ATP-binding protein [Clostridium sp. 'deep sea']